MKFERLSEMPYASTDFWSRFWKICWGNRFGKSALPYAGTSHLFALHRHCLNRHHDAHTHMHTHFFDCTYLLRKCVCESPAYPLIHGQAGSAESCNKNTMPLVSSIQSSLAPPQPEPLQHPPLFSKIVAYFHRTASFCN